MRETHLARGGSVPLCLVVWPVTMYKYHVTFVLQELATGQSVGILPHLEATHHVSQRVQFRSTVEVSL